MEMTAKENDSRSAILQNAIDKINKQYGTGAVWSALETNIPQIGVVSTGALTLDRALGVGGLPKGRITEIYGPESTGKAQPLSALILTPLGWKSMGEIEPGDLVCTPDSGVVPVLGVFPQGEQEFVKISFSDGSATTATWDHLWTVQTWEDKKQGLYRTLTTKEIYEDFRTPSRLKYMIPLNGFVRFETKEVKIDPYIMGLLLGDGSFRDSTIGFTTEDKEIVTAFQLYAERTNQSVVKVGNTKYDWNIKKAINGNGKAIVRLDLEFYGLAGMSSHDKFIPRDYLYGDSNQRLSLLQGLMDTDGTIGTQGSISYTSTSKSLAEGVLHLVRSLGGRGLLSNKQTHYTHNGQYLSGKPAWIVSILFTNGTIPFRLAKKQGRIKIRVADFATRWIADIEVVGRTQCQCIFIDHPDGLYITDDFIVTHNTTLALSVIANVQAQGGSAVYIDVEHALDLNYAKTLGVNVEKLLVSQPDSAEQALEIAETLVRHGAACVVLDSVAMLVTQAEIEGSMSDFQVGSQARLIGKALRKLMAPIDNADCVFILINQIREKVGIMYGSPETTPGGRAIKYMASVRIDLRKKEQIKDEQATIGIRITAKVVKNKVAPPSRQADFDIFFNRGIDKFGGLIDAATDAGVLTRNGAWYKFGDRSLGAGREKVSEVLRGDPMLVKQIQEKL